MTKTRPRGVVFPEFRIQKIRTNEGGTLKESPSSRYRWVICGLLFAATTINYMDRQVLAILAPTLQHEIPWNEFQYGLIVTGFQAAYAFGQALLGWAIDILGTRAGYALSVAIWSVAAIAHGWMRTPLGFGAARAAL